MADYKLPSTTVDAIIEKDGKILMIRRKSDTFNDHLALPGGFVDYGEAVEHAVKREVLEELGVTATPLDILGVYSDPKRDPRGHVISIIFVCSFSGKIKAGDDAKSFEWVALENIKKEKLAFDHLQILNHYIIWKRNKGSYWSNK